MRTINVSELKSVTGVEGWTDTGGMESTGVNVEGDRGGGESLAWGLAEWGIG